MVSPDILATLGIGVTAFTVSLVIQGYVNRRDRASQPPYDPRVPRPF